MMKTDIKYLSRAKEIRDKAPGGKKADQPMTTRVEAATTSQKRKHYVVPGGLSES